MNRKLKVVNTNSLVTTGKSNFSNKHIFEAKPNKLYTQHHCILNSGKIRGIKTLHASDNPLYKFAIQQCGLIQKWMEGFRRDIGVVAVFVTILVCVVCNPSVHNAESFA